MATTTVDEHRDSAEEHLKEACKDLLKILDEDTWGHNEYSKDWLEDVADAWAQLKKIRAKLF